MRIFDFRWKDSSESVFQIIQNGVIEEKVLEKGQKICITMKNTVPDCVGHIKKGDYITCPQNATGTKKCEICKKEEDYFPCQFCNGFNCDRFRDQKIENCDSEHMVYLALFNTDIVKVGVSRQSRGKARQFEQGSHFTRVFAEGMSGIMARRIETSLTKCGFPDKIPATKKKDILFPHISFSEGEKILTEKFELAKDQIISNMPEMRKYILEDQKVWDMRPYYSQVFEDLSDSSKPVHIVSLENDESIGGRLVAIKGPFLVIETETERAVVLAKTLVGKGISFNECPDGITKNDGFQGALF